MADKVNKVVYGDETLIDLTEDTVTEDTLAKGTTAHNAAGLAIEGTFEDAIQHIKVNGTEQPIEDNTVDLDIPTKVSELDNDVPYVEQEAQSAIDAGFDARITALEASADWVYVEDDSLIFTANASYADEVLTITGDASVDDEVLMFGGESPSGVSTETFSLSGCSFTDWTIRSFTIPVDGAPIGVVGAWSDNSNCFLGDFQLNDGGVTVKGFSDGNQGSVTIYATVLYA